MSHVATVEIDVKDLDALDAACGRLGLELVRGQTTYRWFGQHVGDFPLPAGFSREDLGHCEHAIRIPGAKADADGDLPYEIGIVRRRDGRPGYQLLWDFFCGGFGLQARVGNDCCRLRQAYATVVASRQAQRQGFSVQERAMQDGSVRLVFSK